MWLSLPDAQFDVVLADPPWSYYGSGTKWAAAAKFYDTVSDDELATFPIQRLIHRRSVVFVWATGPRLDAAVKLLDAWNLHFRGVAFTWVKTKKDGTPIGAQGIRPSIVKPTCEFVLVGSNTQKGRPLRLADESVRHTVLASVREHSAKPEEVHERIERLYPDASRLELFARRQRQGWTCWGNELVG
jgi:N6-adenosine-specific RNA methylase IME4